jgi:hypothetical protein
VWRRSWKRPSSKGTTARKSAVPAEDADPE